MATLNTGGSSPPELFTNVPNTGGALPANPVRPAGTAAPTPTSYEHLTGTGAPTVVNNMLSSFLNPANPLMATARQSGLDQAARRGLINGSIAAGNSTRAAMDSVMPLVGYGMDVFNRREGEQFQLGRDKSQSELANWLSGENYNRSLSEATHNAELSNWMAGNSHGWNMQEATHNAGLSNWLAQNNHGWNMEEAQQNATLNDWLAGQNSVRSLAAASHQAGLNDWLSNQQYTREFNGALSMVPIVNSMQLNQLLAQYAAQNPQTYPPSVVSGLTNFLNQNMFSILKEYFPKLIAAGGGSP